VDGTRVPPDRYGGSEYARNPATITASAVANRVEKGDAYVIRKSVLHTQQDVTGYSER
jgi:hypothetical protein